MLRRTTPTLLLFAMPADHTPLTRPIRITSTARCASFSSNFSTVFPTRQYLLSHLRQSLRLSQSPHLFTRQLQPRHRRAARRQSLYSNQDSNNTLHPASAKFSTRSRLCSFYQGYFERGKSMMVQRRIQTFAGSVIVMFILSLCVTAQNRVGTVQGTVKDPNGALIAGATV